MSLSQGLLTLGIQNATVRFPPGGGDEDARCLIDAALRRDPAERPSAAELRISTEAALQRLLASNGGRQAEADGVPSSVTPVESPPSPIAWTPDFSGAFADSGGDSGGDDVRI